MTRNTLDALANLDIQIANLEARLVTELGASRSTIHLVVEQERHRFDHARVHAFVPILVERSARSRLS